ncbi:beta-ketoacyl-ACP synthase [Undibacterium sp. Di26W]|uniref:beta-ketoacyl-ACP synthase n=1 Tax=Undibacterium sp. Di26W TaxID=3413035 RepID=UPI003BEF96A4
MKLYLHHCGVVCALGDNHQEIRRRLLEDASTGLQMTDAWSAGRVLPVGQVRGILPDVSHLPVTLRSRNNQLALAALAQIREAVDVAIQRFGADRVGIVIGTSTSGIASTESAMRAYHEHGSLPSSFQYAVQEMGSPAAMLAHELGTGGPAYTHSSACSSSAKAMASAARLIKMGVCDAVLTGGVDSLCEFTVAGFSALESVSTEFCNPLSANRKGINIGEGAAFFLMTAEPAPATAPGAVALCGWGESSDGHHMSAPDPAGGGARMAITQALQRAGIAPSEVDYINLHGTATVQNDAMESHVIQDIFGAAVAVSSTKPFTGHALGAAAAIEAALCWLVMQDDNPQGLLPPHLWDGMADPQLPALHIVAPRQQAGKPLRWIVSNSFAFGGSNACLVLGKTE